ncbi:3-keto-5-aminohexanoate cleavage protein [Flagellimonas sp. S174]|uniref:3-keto-5-aminohexanoate cleavage protein n=1 Tax=Flagellimonas sp. S174 TaxID=3410790 RepID=UPI003BF5DCD6
MSEKLIINFTPTGMIPTKDLTPHVPITVSEIVDDVLKAADIGITMVHLHARDEKNGRPTYKKELYGKIIEGIRTYYPDLVICVSLSGRDFSEFEKRSDPLLLKGRLKPDMGSLTLSSLNFNSSASVNSPEMIQKLAKAMLDNGIVPELEVFDVGMINYSKYLLKKGLINPPFYFNLILGNIACAQATLLNTGIMINELPENSIWSIGGIGNTQLKMNSIAIAMDGGVRIGIEDNIWYDNGRTRLASNADFIKRIHTLANANEREVMTAAEFRSIMNLENGKDSYGRFNQ